jgi:hypothetical protein
MACGPAVLAEALDSSVTAHKSSRLCQVSTRIGPHQGLPKQWQSMATLPHKTWCIVPRPMQLHPHCRDHLRCPLRRHAGHIAAYFIVGSHVCGLGGGDGGSACVAHACTHGQ